MTRLLPTSLLGRQTLGKLAVMLFLAVLLPVLSSRTILAVANRTVTEQVRRDARMIAASLRYANGRWRLIAEPYAVSSLMEGDPESGFLIRDDRGAIIAQSPGAAMMLASLPQVGTRRRTAAIASAENMVVAGPHRTHVIVYRARQTANVIVDRVARETAFGFSFLILAALALSLLVSLAILRITMRSLRRAAREAAEIGPETLARRIGTSSLPDEVRQLVDAANAALDRVEEGYRLQSHFAAAIAHELRAPIALLRLKCEALDSSPVRDDLLRAVDRQSHILRQVMTLAMLEGMKPVTERLDLVEVIRDMATDLANQVYSSGRTLEFLAPDRPVWVRGNRDYLFSIVSNLIGNAVRHTPAGTHIRVEVEPDGAFSISDDGPGISATGGSRRNRRYIRADQKRSDGAGMGLRIVEGTVEMLGGTLAIATGGPGCVVRVELRTL